MRGIFARGLAGLMFLGIAVPAVADCFDGVGCTDSARYRVGDLMRFDCESLYRMRNGIYAQHGYCFHTQRGIATFGNSGCVSGNPNALGLSRIEQGNATTILQAEHAMGCPE